MRKVLRVYYRFFNSLGSIENEIGELLGDHHRSVQEENKKDCNRAQYNKQLLVGLGYKVSRNNIDKNNFLYKY